MLRRLLPDFAEERAVYRRRRDGQMHVVELYPYLTGRFKVELGVHFEVVPSFPSFLGGDERGVWVCALRHQLLHDGGSLWSYGKTIAEAERTVEVIADAALAAFDREAKWEAGETLLAALPPDLVRDDSRIFAQIFSASTIEEQRRLIESMAMERLLPGWGPVPGSMALLLAYLARAHGRPPSVVNEYLSLFAGDRRPWGPPWQEMARALAERPAL
jgi:hypothetical protein